MSLAASNLIRALGLLPHPEGGHYVETFRHPSPTGTRAPATAIYFLLRAGETSWWHRIDATEMFHYYAGLPLEIFTYRVGSLVERWVLGPDVLSGQRPQVLIEPGVWQMARPLPGGDQPSEVDVSRSPIGPDYSLVGCTVSPAFEFAGFELASVDFAPPGS